MVDGVVGQVAETVERRGRVQVHRHARPAVLVLADALDARSLVVVRRADRLADHVPVRAARNDVHLLELHDVHQLRPHLACLAQRLGMQKVTRRPVIAVAARKVSMCFAARPRMNVPVGLPLRIDVQERQVVALRHKELFARRVALLEAFLWAIEHGRDREHRHDREHL